MWNRRSRSRSRSRSWSRSRNSSNRNWKLKGSIRRQWPTGKEWTPPWFKKEEKSWEEYWKDWKERHTEPPWTQGPWTNLLGVSRSYELKPPEVIELPTPPAAPEAELLPVPRRWLRPSVENPHPDDLQAKLSMLMEQMTVLQAQVNRLEKHAAEGVTGSAAAPEALMLAVPGDAQSETESESDDAEVDQQRERELEAEIHQEVERFVTAEALPERLEDQPTADFEKEEACDQEEPCALTNQGEVGEAIHPNSIDGPGEPEKMEEDQEPWSPPSPSDPSDFLGPTVEDPLEFFVPPGPKPGLLCPGFRSSGLLRVHFEEEPVATIEVPNQPLEEWWTHPRRGEVQCALCELLVLETDTFVTELHVSELPHSSGLLQPSYHDLVCSQCLKDHMIPPERVSNTPGRGSIGWLKVDNFLSSPRNDVETSSPALAQWQNDEAADVQKDIDVQSDGGSTETEMDSDEEQQRRAQVLLDSL